MHLYEWKLVGQKRDREAEGGRKRRGGTSESKKLALSSSEDSVSCLERTALGDYSILSDDTSEFRP